MMESDLPPGSCNSTGHLSTIGYRTLPGRMHHSASTPAGVDGAGGGARTPPATPKKGGKMLAVRVQMLDDSVSMFQIQSKALGRVLFDQVCRQLHLLEADYFGLEYQDANGTKYWLDVEKLMCRQVGLSMLEPTLRFCVKFYTPDPARLEEEFTRYLFCLQIKRDLATGCIHCNENTAALMASYIVQAECGDFVPEDYPDHGYLSGYKFFPAQDPESERRIMENHKKHVGQSPAEADLNLLETARRCELYGVKMHPAKDHEGTPLNLAVAHMGIVVFQHFTKINTFSWAKIRKISFKRKKFLIKLHPEGYGYYRDVVEFFFEGRNECKNFWKKCVENHGFFRCSTVPRLPRHKTRVMSRGSSFRYSGKTQKQIVEFVRDNYVKRQTFQRSGSFRASRGNVSHASAAAPPAHTAHPARLNASLSAHPLLPLPPGSDAISLEWDKQPHYLEASLMMKGYTAEEAREAALRAGSGEQRARTLGATRPPLAPTAFASTRDRLTKLYCNQIQQAERPDELVTHAEVNHHATEDSPLPHRTTTPLVSPESIWRPASAGTTGRARAPTPPAARRPNRAEQETSPEDDSTVSSASALVSASIVPPSPSYIDGTTLSPADNDDDDAATSSLSPAAERLSPLVEDVALMSPRSVDSAPRPLCASTPHPRALTNGHDAVDNVNNNCDTLNGNVHVKVVESSTSMDVLSGGESDAGDTLSRRNNNSISSCVTVGTLRDAGSRRRDVTYCVAKELLMTERTYKRDLELLTVTWSSRVSSLGSEGGSKEGGAGAAGGDAVRSLARACLALEPLALAQGALLARLERQTIDAEEPEYKRIADILDDYLSNTYDSLLEYVACAGGVVGVVESVRRRDARAQAAAAAFDAAAPLPLACLLLRPLHRLLHYAQLANALCVAGGGGGGGECSEAVERLSETTRRLARDAREELAHVENHAALCQMQRDIAGYDKLLVADREFLRLGCVYKHSAKGLQQKMLFLFNDLLLVCSRGGGGGGGAHGAQFRATCALRLCSLRLTRPHLPNSFTLTDENASVTFSTSNEQECSAWCDAIEDALTDAHAREHANGHVIDANTTSVSTSTDLVIHAEHDAGGSTSGSTGGGGSGGALAGVCWHRATSLTRHQLHLATRSGLSGYLLRKFKNSHGWQKLWVVFAMFTLFFYKSWQDDTPLASLPLLGYSVGPPSASDGIHKDYVFKLQFKNHVYFFRADSGYTYNRWIEVLKLAMVHHPNQHE